MAYYPSRLKKWGAHVPRDPTKLRPWPCHAYIVVPV